MHSSPCCCSRLVGNTRSKNYSNGGRDRIPEDPVAEHMWAAHSGENVPSRASDAYVQAVFDQFATEYDVMLSRLNYRGPQIISQKLNELLPADGSLSVLDAGCGTGLCGPLLKSHAKSIVGVDLSLGMLEKARLRGSYHDLFQQELTQFLSSNADQFDLIVSSDCLAFFGDLTDVAQNAAIALRENGFFLFTLEALDSDNMSQDYAMGRQGRYKHALEYVGVTVQRAGLRVHSIEDCSIRTEGAAPLRGVLSRCPAFFVNEAEYCVRPASEWRRQK